MLTSTLINRVHLSHAASHFTFHFFPHVISSLGFLFHVFSFPCVFFLTNSYIFKILCYSKLLLSNIVNVDKLLHTVSHSQKKKGYLENALVEIPNYSIPYGMHKIKLNYKILYLSQYLPQRFFSN